MSGEWARWEQPKLTEVSGNRRDVPRAGCNWRTELTGGEVVSDQLDHPVLRGRLLRLHVFYEVLENCSGEGQNTNQMPLYLT